MKKWIRKKINWDSWKRDVLYGALALIIIALMVNIVDDNLNKHLTISEQLQPDYFRAIMLAFLFILAWGLAGVSIFRSLISVGAGLSVLSFLATTYCKVPDKFRNADNELRVIVIFGLIYILFWFLISLHKELFGNKLEKNRIFKDGMLHSLISKDEKERMLSIIIIILYLIFIVTFVLSLIKVGYSIFASLCIFN